MNGPDERWPHDARPLRLVPALVELRDRYGDPVWFLGIELWTHMIVLRFAGIESEMTMNNEPAEWFRVEDDLGVTYRPAGGSWSGGSVGSPLEHKNRFSGNLDLTPGLTEGATTLTVSFSARIPADPVDISL